MLIINHFDSIFHILCLFTDAPELLFIQVPDTLPGEPKEKDIDMEHGGQKHNQSSISETNKEEETLNTSYEVLAKKLGLVSLEEFSEGYIGKIQVNGHFWVSVINPQNT